MDISVITPRPFGEGTGEGPLTYRGISVITPLPLGEGKGEGPLTHMGISVITPLPSGLLFLHIFFKTCIEGYLVFKYS